MFGYIKKFIIFALLTIHFAFSENHINATGFNESYSLRGGLSTVNDGGFIYNIMPSGIYTRSKEQIGKNRQRFIALNKSRIGIKLSVETKLKMSITRKGKSLSEKHKLAISLGSKGKIFTEKHKKNIGKSRKGKKFPKLSEAKKGKIPPCVFTRRNYKGENNPFYGKKHTLKTIEEMKNDLRTRHYGENNFKWKGGITPENVRIRNCIEYKEWRKAVYRKDYYTCIFCGYKGKDLTAHHVQNFAQYIELRFVVNNGITFCRFCHKEFHKKYSSKNNTKDQIIEFLQTSQKANGLRELNMQIFT